MRMLTVWYEGNEIAVHTGSGKCVHWRPATDRNAWRVGKLLERAYRSNRYTFRPFIAGTLGIVATKVG